MKSQIVNLKSLHSIHIKIYHHIFKLLLVA